MSTDNVVKLCTDKEVYDYVVAFLTRQGQASHPAGDPYECRYRVDGMACAVGCLIAEEDYSPDIEGLDATTVQVRNAVRSNTMLGGWRYSRSLLGILQQAHDDASVATMYGSGRSFVDEFKERAARFHFDANGRFSHIGARVG